MYIPGRFWQAKYSTAHMGNFTYCIIIFHKFKLKAEQVMRCAPFFISKVDNKPENAISMTYTIVCILPLGRLQITPAGTPGHVPP